MSVEYADGFSKSSFPKEWGRPPGDAYSEERARWVLRKVREHVAGAPMPQLRAMSILMQRLQEEHRDA